MTAKQTSSRDSVMANLHGLLPNLETFYKDVHAHPELSMQETRTASLAAERLRADMDALPVEEVTGVAYASKVKATDAEGRTVPVRHACGHDIHVAWLAGATTLLAQARSAWRGTLMAVFQPAEETAAGAQAMIDDGLFKRFPKPDVALGQHVIVGPAGMLGARTSAITSPYGILIHNRRRLTHTRSAPMNIGGRIARSSRGATARPWFTVMLGAVALALPLAAAAGGDYTKEQAQTGAQTYSATCSVCHGSRLQGGAAPALKGAAFAQTLSATYPTMSKLFQVISTQMPASNPGSLSKEQYTQVLAFILAENGYPSGSTPLDTAHLDDVALLPYPEQGAKTAEANLEIQNIGSSNRTVVGALPDKAVVTISDAMMGSANSHPADWLLHGRDYSNQRFSPLKDINAGNVSSLVPVALVQTGITSSFETTPIVINGVMYATTPVVDHKMKILAVRANSGDIIWESTYDLGDFKICCGPVNRGVAVGYGNVYVVTLDDRLIALDAATGEVRWNVGVADPSIGYSETMAPQIYKGTIIVGSAGGEWPIRGFVAAFDANTGKEIWRWQATDPKSFAGDTWQHGGGMVWTTPAIDTRRDLIIFSTGNPNPDLYGANRKGDNLYTDSIVALHASTGKLAWFFQEVPHDVWDYDAVSNVVLFDTVDHGKTVAAAGEAGKTGWFYIVNRDTGKLIRRSEAFVDQSKNMFTQPTKQGVQMLPGANGGAEWSPPAYSPLTHDVYILGMNQLMTFTTGDDPGFQPGTMRLGSAFTNVAKGPVQNGVFTAIDVDTGKVAWQYKAKQPLIGGALATAGNLVFMGEGDGYFDAFDATSGEKLWRFNLGAGVNAPPITYSVDGVQYVAVASGGNFQMGFPYGDTIAIFKLAK